MRISTEWTLEDNSIGDTSGYVLDQFAGKFDSTSRSFRIFALSISKTGMSLPMIDEHKARFA